VVLGKTVQEEDPVCVSTPGLALLARFLPERTTLALEAWHVDDAAAPSILDTISPHSPGSCPLCHVQTTRVHRRYTRTVAAGPWGASAVRLHRRVRQFFCDNPTCPRQSFTERLPAGVAPWARRTRRLAQPLSARGSARGGQAGARLAARGPWRTSPDTLLRLVQAAPVPDIPAPHIIGVDAWAWRRGQRDGTIRVNREDHRGLELWPERSVESLAAWLAQPPSVTIVCRERSALYADGLPRGAPEAVHVVERLHLGQHLRAAVEALLHDQPPALQATAARPAQARPQQIGAVGGPPMSRGRHHSVPVRQQQLDTAQQQRHALWVATSEAVHALRTQGTPSTTIAPQLGRSRPTVSRWLRRTAPPPPRSPQRAGQV
jgi:hypothetical protein